MKLEDIKPMHCHALASRLLTETGKIRTEMGRQEDGRAIPEISGAEPREVYFEALGTLRKATRLASELGVESSRPMAATPALRELSPGHVLLVLENVLSILGDIKTRLAITEPSPATAPETGRQPSDVLTTLIRVNRDLSRVLERPFTPSDVFATVSLASTYATRLGASAKPAPFERGRQPAHCYAKLESCLEKAAQLVAKRGGKALTSRGAPADVLPGDVYDLSNLVLGEVAYLHSLVPDAAPLHAFEPAVGGHRLPSHVHQLASALEAQLSSLG